MIPPELLKWADLPTIALVILASQLLRPVVEDLAWIKKDKDRIVFLPICLGMLIGVLVEVTTSEFDLYMAVRRILVDAFGAAGVFKTGKVMLQGAKNGNS